MYKYKNKYKNKNKDKYKNKYKSMYKYKLPGTRTRAPWIGG